MNAFDPTFKTGILQRTVELIPLLYVVLVDGSTAYLSDRLITTPGGQTWYPRISDWSGISSEISKDGSTPTSTAAFTLSNVDRVMELACRDHMFQRGICILYAYNPALYSSGIDVAARFTWLGWISDCPYDEQSMTLNCSDGLYDLTLPLPKRRFDHNCEWTFDDGLQCPYSGFGYTGAGFGSPIAVPDLAFSDAVDPLGGSDFGPALTMDEGYNAFPGLVTCDLTYGDEDGANGCKQHGMSRFFGGQRYVTSWAATHGTGVFGQGDPYNSFSSQDATVFNTGIPMLYCGLSTGFMTTPVILEWRPEENYMAVTCIVSEGPIGNTVPPVDGGQSDYTVGAIGDVLVDSIEPHAGENPSIPGFGVNRSAGRIGENSAWDEISGDLQQSDEPGDPPVYFSSLSGFFARVFEKGEGVNDPSGKSNQTPAGEPQVAAQILAGRRCWQYAGPVGGPYTRTYGATGNIAWVILDMYLEALNIKYAISDRHEEAANLDTFIAFALYCQQSITGLTGDTVTRYVFAGILTDIQPTMDILDSALRDCQGYRWWREGKLCIAPFSACQSYTTPAFQEFVNILHLSTKPTIPNPAYNDLFLNFADYDYDFQQNTANVFSSEYEELIGLNGHPFKMTQTYNMLGTCFTEQASRLGIRFLGEELGGQDPTEWAQLREVDLSSTFIFDELEVGDITYITHSLIPNGGDWFRVFRKELTSKWQLNFHLRSWRADNYDDILSSYPGVGQVKYPQIPTVPNSGGIPVDSSVGGGQPSTFLVGGT